MSPPWISEPLSGARYSAAELSAEDDTVYMLDQRRLPDEEIYLELRDAAAVAEAIRDMVVRGAPAIGIAAAYGMALAALAARAREADAYVGQMRESAARLAASRPTAVNLSWAVERCLAECVAHAQAAGDERARRLAALARTIHRQDVAACRQMGRLGAERIAGEGRMTVMTHCNAGALATGGYGTALGVVRALHASGWLERVYACETRPYLQGARLTAWELHADGVPVTVIGDAMAAHCMQRGDVGAVIVGADRIAHNGDVANKIGTYGLACLAAAHSIPLWVAAPWSTVDLATPRGADIVIEHRSRDELALIAGQRLVPAGVAVENPAFDVTPARLIAGIITERGIFASDGLPERALR